MDWFFEQYLSFYQVGRDVNLDVNYLQPELHLVYDNKACNQCNNRVCEGQLCVLKFQNSTDVDMIDVEGFFLQLDGLRAALRERCDLMFWDKAHKIVFSDMSCTKSKYVEPYWGAGKEKCGKRAKAYAQIQSVISKFMEVPALKSYIENLDKKVGLFALREKDIVITSQIEKNMEVFKMSPALNNMIVDMGNGFNFVNVKYPNVYHW